MEGLCRGCLKKFPDSIDLLQYCERNRRMFVYITGLQVKRHDSFTFQLCKECYTNMKLACKFKKQCRSSDKKFKNYMLFKGDDDSINFDTYIKNVEDPIALRFPSDIGNGTPAHSKNKDDDNESTCTSIRNFMTDILDGEEMPATEARIIREVIQEETDILDESLDSHWLRDDISVADSEMMDFSFSAFSTPCHSINNDHCFTTRTLTDERIRELNYYTSKKIVEIPNETEITRQSDMPILNDINFENDANNHLTGEANNAEDCIHFNNDKQVQDKNDFSENNHNRVNSKNLRSLKESLFPNGEILNENDSSLLDYEENALSPSLLENINDQPLPNSEMEYCVNESLDANQNIGSELIGHNIIKENNNKMAMDVQHRSIAKELKKYTNKNKRKMDNSSTGYEIIDNDNVNNANISSELEEYICNEILKAKNQQKYKLGCNDCTIEKNLERALRNVNKQDFMLDQLLTTPQGSLRSGASTPTIRNILFGNITPNSQPGDIANIDANNKEKKVGSSNSVKTTYSKGKDIEKLTKILKPVDVGSSENSPCSNQSENSSITVRGVRQINDKSYRDESLRDSFRDEAESSDTQLDFRDNEIFNYNNSPINELSNNEDNANNNVCETETPENEDKFDINDTEIFMAFNEDAIKLEDEVKSSSSTLGQYSDISFSKLLQVEDSELDPKALQIDNLSICSDFLHHEMKIEDDGFKKPLPPMDDQYDLDASLCKICNKTYNEPRALKIHFAKIHHYSIKGPKKPRINKQVNKICERCGAVFKYAAGFIRHTKNCNLHDNNKRCNICMEDFETKVGLKQHMRIHNPDVVTVQKEKQYICNVCGKKMFGYTNFRTHERRHTKNYKVFCEFCQAGFYRNRDLKLHISTHTQERPFACSHCGKRFVRRIDCRKHMMRHKGKYRCDNCSIELMTKTHIRRHIKSKVCLKTSVAKENKTPSKPSEFEIWLAQAHTLPL